MIAKVEQPVSPEQLSEYGKHMSGIAQSLRIEERRANPRTLEEIEEATETYPALQKKLGMNDEKFEDYTREKQQGLERAANILAAAGNLIEAVNNGEHVRSSLELFQKINRKYGKSEGIDITHELKKAKKWIEAVERDISGRVPYIAYGSKQEKDTLYAVDTIDNKLLPEITARALSGVRSKAMAIVEKQHSTVQNLKLSDLTGDGIKI